MNEEKRSNCVLGFVPGRRTIGIAVHDGAHLQHYGVISLKRYKADNDKMAIVIGVLSDLVSRFRLKAIVTLKLCPKRSTGFNIQLISTLNQIAVDYFCSLHSFSLREVKELLGKESRIQSQRQLAKTLSDTNSELSRFLPTDPSRLITDKEKYYQPLFLATGLAYSYLKSLENEQQSLQNP